MSDLTTKEFEMVMWCVAQMRDDAEQRILGWTPQEYAAYERASDKLKRAKVVRLIPEGQQ